MRRILGVMAFTVAAAGFVSVPVSAQSHPTFDIPIDTVIRDEPGAEIELATEPVPAEDVGRECNVSVESVNNSSVREGVDLVVRSGGSEVEVPNVEREADERIEATGTLVLDTEVSVFVRLADDGVFSGGMVMTLDCPTPPPPPPTESSTTTAPPAPPEDEDVPPPAPPAVPVPGDPNFVG